MSIARMKKLSALGLVSDREELLERLMAVGVVEISAQEDKLNDDQWRDLVSKDSDENTVASYDSKITRVSQALDVIEKHSEEKKPLLKTRRIISLGDFQKARLDGEPAGKQVDAILDLYTRYGGLSNEINKAETLKLSLKPWLAYPLQLEESGTKTTDIILGITPATVETEKFKASMEELVPRSIIELVHSDEEQHYYYLICDKGQREIADDVFRNFGFSKLSLNDLIGTAEENTKGIEERIEDLSKQKQKVEEEIRSYEEFKKNLELYHDDLVINRDRAAIRQNLLVTAKTFSFDGWLPAAAEGKISKILAEMECYFEISEPDKNDQTPVLLLNGGFSDPFESITKLYALPDSRSIDATPFFALSYAIFFGMMLGDGAYGIIMTVITGLVLKKYKLEGMKRQMIKLFFYCGISTAFWGAMFGGWFGDFVEIVGKTFFNADISIPPIWFNPLDDPMKLLIFCFILGGIHLFVGMGLAAWISIKDGRPLDAIFDVGLWYVLLIGLVLLLLGVAAPLGKWMSIIGALGIIATGGRNKKGLGKIVGGLGSLYGITGYLSDVLSYSRLLALGLASGVIASVVNTMGSFGGASIKGALLMAFAFIIGHTYNFAINGLGSFVHSCRLQYVEFFGKFYVSGGEAFQPFGENTKYIAIQREEN